MFIIIKNLIKTSWNLLVVFSLDIPVCSFSMALKTSESRVSVKTDASKSKALIVMERLNPPNRITPDRKSESIAAAIFSAQQIKLVNCMFSNS